MLNIDMTKLLKNIIAPLVESYWLALLLILIVGIFLYLYRYVSSAELNSAVFSNDFYV